MLNAHTIYGPPGTGKTSELMRRIEELKQRGYDASDIGFLSHTRAAAAEALQRLDLKYSDKVSTLHSLCFRTLNLTRHMVVERTQLSAFATDCGVPIKGGSADDEEQLDVGDEYLAIWHRARNTFTDPRVVFDHTDTTGSWDQCDYFLKAYEAWKRKRGFVDFTDMLVQYTLAPQEHGARVLLIDEAQDLSPLQWKVIDKLLSFDVDEVHIAGDDDQAIYVWGGADPHGMVRFEEQRKASPLVLPQSWRIPLRVHKLAESVIKRVQQRVPKVYKPRDEDGTISEHSDLYGLNLDPNESTLLLARTGARRREIERFLVSDCVPYVTEGGFPGLLQNRTARALRTVHALRRGEPVKSEVVTTLAQQATARAQPLLKMHKYADLVKLDDDEIVNIPHWQERYYSRVDVDVKPSIKLMTIHASKGREADRVVLDTSLTSRVVNGMADDPDSEARVFYVGITRARQRLDIVHGSQGYEL